jgi:RNA polymerase sigma-B factor
MVVRPASVRQAGKIGKIDKGVDVPSATATTTTTTKMSSKRPMSGDGLELKRLFIRWQRHGDHAARETLVRRFMPLARSLARRYGSSSEPFEDLLQVASLGLLKAVDRYDVGRGYSFSSYAVPTIVGEMRRYFRDAGWAVHVPRGAQERALKVRDTQERLTRELGRAPTVNQMAQRLELHIEEVVDALAALQAYEAFSLDARQVDGRDELASYGESVGADDERYELVELDATLASVLSHLGPHERLILRMRFVEDLTQTEIAARMGISQMQVSRQLRRSLDRLRALTRAPVQAG